MWSENFEAKITKSKRNEKFEAKISEKIEVKFYSEQGNTWETDPILLYFDSMRKIFFSKTGAPYFQASGKIFQKAGVELSGPFFQCPWRTFTICCQQKRQRFQNWVPPVLCVWFLFSIRCQQKRQMFHGSHICSSPPSCLLSHVWLRYIYSTTLITVDVMLGVSTSEPQPPHLLPSFTTDGGHDLL